MNMPVPGTKTVGNPCSKGLEITVISNILDVIIVRFTFKIPYKGVKRNSGKHCLHKDHHSFFTSSIVSLSKIINKGLWKSSVECVYKYLCFARTNMCEHLDLS